MYTFILLYKLLVYMGVNSIVTHTRHLGFQCKSPSHGGGIMVDIIYTGHADFLVNVKLTWDKNSDSSPSLCLHEDFRLTH